MKILLKILFTAIAVIILAQLLPGIKIENYTTAISVAIVLGLLRVFVKPLLALLTLPLTVLTLGLFSFIINAVIILLAGNLVNGFEVSGFINALLFSLLLSFSQSVLYTFLKK